MTAPTKLGDFTKLEDSPIFRSDVLHPMSAPSDCTASSPQLYELYARAVVRCAFFPFENYVDSPQEASMYQAESILSLVTRYADDFSCGPMAHLTSDHS